MFHSRGFALGQRNNRKSKSLLKKLAKVINSPESWKKYLSTVQYTINNTYNSAIKASPSNVLFGFDQRNHEDHSLKILIEDIAKTLVDPVDKREMSRNVAIEASEKLRKYNRLYYDKHHRKSLKYKEDPCKRFTAESRNQQ
ncbi:hypothetical protein P5V15_007100 [Pogonomyrmex californicus]